MEFFSLCFFKFFHTVAHLLQLSLVPYFVAFCLTVDINTASVVSSFSKILHIEKINYLSGLAK